MSLIIDKSQIDPNKPPKCIGKSRGIPVYEIVTKGGLNMVVCKGPGGSRILGAGPHRALARQIAMVKDPDFQLEELSKSEENPELFKHLIPHWSEITDQINIKFK